MADIADHAAGHDLPMAVGGACRDDGANGGSIDSFNTSNHGRHLQFQIAEVAIPRYLFTDTLRLIAELRLPPDPTSARDVWLSRDRSKLWKRCVWMTTKPAFPALGAPISPAWVHGSPHVEELALSKSLKSGNFTLAKAVIRWMSVNVLLSWGRGGAAVLILLRCRIWRRIAVYDFYSERA